MWFFTMWLLDDNPSRCASRTLSALHLKMGEQARLTVDRKVRHPPGRFARPEFIRRIAFWTSMAGEIKIVDGYLPAAAHKVRDPRVHQTHLPFCHNSIDLPLTLRWRRSTAPATRTSTRARRTPPCTSAPPAATWSTTARP